MDRYRIFLIAAVVSETRVCNAATASKFPAVAGSCPTSAGTGTFFRAAPSRTEMRRPSLDLLNKGTAPEGVLFELLKDDAVRDQRKLAIIDMTGKAPSHNPTAAGMGSRYRGAMTGRGLALPNSRQSHCPRKKVAKSTSKSCGAGPKEKGYCLSPRILRNFLDAEKV